MSLRWARSPEPPKMTIVEGSGIRESRSPSRSGFSTVVAMSYSFLSAWPPNWLRSAAATLIA